MNRRLLPIAAALAAGLGSCTLTAPTVAFNQICLPPSGGDCIFAATCGAQYIGPVEMDVAVTNQLWLVLEVHNQALNNADPKAGRVNTQDAYIQEIQVSYSGGAVAIPGTSTRMQQVVPANGTAAISVFPIPASAGLTSASIGAGTSTMVIAEVTGKGVFGDGSSFETPGYEIPVTICNGCVGSAVCVDSTTTPPTVTDATATCPPYSDGQRPLGVSCG